MTNEAPAEPLVGLRCSMCHRVTCQANNIDLDSLSPADPVALATVLKAVLICLEGTTARADAAERRAARAEAMHKAVVDQRANGGGPP